MSFSAEYSLWYIMLCLLLAAAGSWFLYWYNKPELSGRYAKWVHVLLTGFRFLSLFILSFLLLGPLMKIWNRYTEKPLVILALDGSESVISGKDAAFYKTDFKKSIEALQASLGNDYEVKTYQFGKTLSNTFTGEYKEKQTNIAQVFDEIKTTYSGQNLGAVVLATDGIYNDGNNPLYAAKEVKAPVFTIALGDTVQQKDLLIRQVKFNQLVYAGNFFPLQIDISAFGYKNEVSKLTVSRNGQTLFTQNIAVNNELFFTTVPVSLEAKEAGTQHYTVTLSALRNEITLINNRYDVFVNVINGKQKIALVAFAPHPDIAAYKQAIEQNENYAITTSLYNEFDVSKLKDYSLVVFHQVPGPRGEGAELIRQAKQQKTPLLYVLGAQTNLAALNNAEPAVSISSSRAAVNEILPSVNPGFSLFTLSDEELEVIKKFPPLVSPYGNYSIKAEADVLFKQQIGYVKTDYPLLFFTKGAGNKAGFICGEGFWKWRLYDAALSEQRTTASLAGKIIQFLAAKDDRSRFRINGQKRFDENEPVHFDAEVYNESFELINYGEVQLVIQNAQGKKFNFAFSKTEKAYTINAGILPVGNYTYEASTTIGNAIQKTKGQFAVMPLQVELLQTRADHQLLNELAGETGGKLFYPAQVSELEKSIRASETIKPVIYQQEDIKSWINLKWIFFIILGLLTAEWFIRKWNGNI